MEISTKGRLVAHISKEIETHTKDMMTFRTRANLPVFLGPFVLLSSVVIGAERVPTGIVIDWVTVAAFVGLALSYFLMAISAARIELQIWDQCNTWRGLIAKLVDDTPPSNDEIKRLLEFPPFLKKGYLVVYAAMFSAFICTLILILRIF